MSTETTARRLAAHPRFQLEAGQRATVRGMTFRIHLHRDGRLWAYGENNGQQWALESFNLAGVQFDLNDPATIGTIEAQARAICPGLILFPPEKPGDMWAIGRDMLTCLAYAPSIGECWALAFLEVAK